MAEKQTCEACGAELPANAPQGLCPRCLANMGLSVLPPIESSKADFVIERTGTMIGRYKLLEKIGEGGFGVVYMAEQQEPVQRKVALKIIKPGMDTREVIARFEAERQAIALMDHPNIAQVLDAGATEAGRPYFVMELVRGIPITDYCDQKNLPTRDRLQLFMKVCQAVQHAHQKAVIHRDIKPSNVLVTEHDGEPVPKVIDFGVAKALGHRLTEKTLFTGFHHMLGTPAYMSPEQAALSGLDIDTRADIYSLGVLLYELLTGVTPFDKETFRKAALDEIRRMIQETEPPKPSTRLQTLGEKLTDVAKHRHTEPASLSRLIRGDLDWIAMKCLEKDRQRRYETANGLAMDLQRHLTSEPVMARGPSNLYRFQKLIRRHKLAFAAASAVAMVLVLGVVASTWEALRATRAERDQIRLLTQADQLRGKAEVQATRIGYQLYASHMNVAFQAWERGDLSRAEQLLHEHWPKTGQEDLRGFEWFYLWRLCRSEQLRLLGHNALMRCVIFSPDGCLLATAGEDSTARIWDATTGKLLLILKGHTGGVTSVAFAPDGKVLATGGGDGTVRLWDVATGEELAVLRGHQHGVTALVFNPEGKWLASASGKLAYGGNFNPYEKYLSVEPPQADVEVWDIKERKTIITLTGHTRSILSLAVSPDGKRLATGSSDSTVKIWEVATGRMEANFNPFQDPVIAVAFSPDGRRLAIGGGNPHIGKAKLKIWDIGGNREQMSLKGHEGPVFAVAFAPDGKTLASCGLDQIVRFWNATTGDELRTLKGHKASIWSLAWDPDGKRIATASWDQTVKVWDAVQPQGREVFAGAGGYSGCFTPDGKYLIRGGSRLEVIEVGTGKASFIVPDYETDDLSVAVSPDGSTLASAGQDGRVTLWEVGSWRQLVRMPSHSTKIWCLVFSPDGRTVVSGDDQNVRLWDIRNSCERAVFGSGNGGVRALAFTPDGRTMIAASDKETVFLDATTGERQKKLGHGSQFLAVSPDGRYLVASNLPFYPESPLLELTDLSSMEVKWHINPHRAHIWHACFSPDGRTLATASWDGTTKLWNVASGQEMFSYTAHGVVWSDAFSPDGKWWAVGSGFVQNGEVACFRAATLSEVEAADSSYSGPDNHLQGGSTNLPGPAVNAAASQTPATNMQPAAEKISGR